MRHAKSPAHSKKRKNAGSGALIEAEGCLELLRYTAPVGLIPSWADLALGRGAPPDKSSMPLLCLLYYHKADAAVKKKMKKHPTLKRQEGHSNKPRGGPTQIEEKKPNNPRDKAEFKQISEVLSILARRDLCALLCSPRAGPKIVIVRKIQERQAPSGGNTTAINPGQPMRK